MPTPAPPSGQHDPTTNPTTTEPKPIPPKPPAGPGIIPSEPNQITGVPDQSKPPPAAPTAPAAPGSPKRARDALLDPHGPRSRLEALKGSIKPTMSKVDWSGGDDPRTPEQRKADEEVRKKIEANRNSEEAIDRRRRFLVSRELKQRFGMNVTPEMMAGNALKVPPGSFPVPTPMDPDEAPTLNLSLSKSAAHDAGYEFYTVSDGKLVQVERSVLVRGIQFMQVPRTLDEGPNLKYARTGTIVAIDDDHIFFTEITAGERL